MLVRMSEKRHSLFSSAEFACVFPDVISLSLLIHRLDTHGIAHLLLDRLHQFGVAIESVNLLIVPMLRVNLVSLEHPLLTSLFQKNSHRHTFVVAVIFLGKV